MARIVIDANVMISAAFGGRPLDAVVRAMEGHEVYLSEAIEKELEGVIAKLSKKLSSEHISFIQERIQQLVGLAIRVSVSTRVALCRDPKDDHYLSLCKEAGADFLITGDKDLLSISQGKLKKSGISCRVITPQEFLVLES
jgi:putative PIN family toxin of toxin-antitoxin system